MSHLKGLQGKSATEVRDFIKLNVGNEDLISEIADAKEEWAQLLTKNKAFRDEFLVAFETLADYNMLSKCLVENDFTPSQRIMDGLLEFGEDSEDAVRALLGKFTSFPITNSFVLKLFNSGLPKVATEIIKKRKEFQTHKFLIMVMNSKCLDEEIEELCKGDSLLVECILEIFSRNLQPVSAKFMNYAIEKYKDIRIDFEKACKLKLSALAYTNLYNGKDRYGTEGAYAFKDVEWNEELEKVDFGKTTNFKVLNPPKDSKYRASWINFKPELIETEELIAHINRFSSYETQRKKIECYKEVIGNRGLEAVEKLTLSSLEYALKPAEVRDMINDSKVAKYLYYALNAKYRPQIRTKVDDEDIATKTVRNKKTYYNEALVAISRGSVSEFKKCFEGDYTLEKFIQDSFQSTKYKTAQSTTMSYEFLFKLSKEEFLKLVQSNFRLPYYYYDNEAKSGLKYSVTVSEALSLIKKIELVPVFYACEDKEGFINSLSATNLAKLVGYRSEVLKKHPELAKTYLNNLTENGKNTNFGSDTILELCKYFTKAELKNIKPYYESWASERIIYAKTIDDEYVMDAQDIPEFVIATGLKESTDTILNIKARSPEALKIICKAYLGGNSAMSKLVGKDIKCNRKHVSFYETLLKELDSNPAEIFESLLAEGVSLNKIKTSLSDWKKTLKENDRDITIPATTITYEDLSFLVKTKKLKLKGNILRISAHGEDVSNLIKVLPRLTFDQVAMDNRSNNTDSSLRAVTTLKDHIDFSNYNLINDKTDDLYTSVMFRALRNGIRFKNSHQTENYITNNFSSNTSHYFATVSDMEFLVGIGLQFTDQNIYKLLENSNIKPEAVAWIASRIGDLKGFVINESKQKAFSGVIEELKKHGATLLEKEDFLMHQVQEKIMREGKNFEAVNVESWDRIKKAELIKFIEKRVDQAYAKLNLVGSNLDNVKLIQSYEALKDSVIVDDTDIVRIFKIPATLASNKKLLGSIREFVALHSEIIYKINLMKNVFELLNPDAELVLADFLDYSNHASVSLSESFSRIPIFGLKTILNSSELIIDQNVILKNMDKTAIMRFLRSASEKDDSYLRDIFGMVRTVLTGVEALRGRMEQMKIDNSPKEEIDEITKSVNGLLTRLEEISGMDNVVHMHDRIVPLLQFIKSDPIQPLNQDKFSPLEKSDDVSAMAKVRLFFPKTRSELTELGNAHGWCVNYHSSYGDNVIKNGNILVALVPMDKEPEIDNVVALAHYIHKGNHEFSLEQLKWSKKKKNGDGNVDATRDFNHKVILEIIKGHLSDIQKKKRAA